MCLCTRGQVRLRDASSLWTMLFLCRSLHVLVDKEKALFKKVTTQSNWLFTNLNEKSWVFTLWLCLCVNACQCSFSLNHGSNEITEKNMFHGP